MLSIYQLMKNLQNITIVAYTIVIQWSVSNIKVKCLQFGETVSDIFEHVWFRR